MSTDYLNNLIDTIFGDFDADEDGQISREEATDAITTLLNKVK